MLRQAQRKWVKFRQAQSEVMLDDASTGSARVGNASTSSAQVSNVKKVSMGEKTFSSRVKTRKKKRAFTGEKSVK